MNIPSIDVIVGGQFGSEAKGHVTKRVIERNKVRSSTKSINVRVAGPNAGHCVLDSTGLKFALRSVPVGAVYEDVRLLVAPGSEIEPRVLFNEIEMLAKSGHSVVGRMYVHGEATILTEQHQDQEAGMQARMGSTGKGIGACRADRIMRTARRVKDNDWLVETLGKYGVEVIDDDRMYDLYNGWGVVIEGTQGFGLGLHAGYYPQCTSSDARAVDFLAMAGLDPTFAKVYRPWVVARVHPIRVAGNSGPLKGETTWEDLGLQQEFTTVTKKVRRVGEWDKDLVNAAIRSNGPLARVALTMFDQRVPTIAGANAEPEAKWPDIWDAEVREALYGFQADLDAQIHLVTTGPDTGIWL